MLALRRTAGRRRARLAAPLLRRVCLTLIVVCALSAPVIVRVHAAFTDTTLNNGNTWTSGTVLLGDNDGGSSAILTLSNAAVGANSTGCVQVTYTGSLSATVRLYGSVTGTGLDANLALTITRGTVSSGAFPSCTNFTADSATYAAADGVMYNGTLSGFVGTYPNYSLGLVDPTAGSPATWTNSTTRAYRFSVTVQSGGEGKNTTPTFTWEARNS